LPAYPGAPGHPKIENVVRIDLAQRERQFSALPHPEKEPRRHVEAVAAHIGADPDELERRGPAMIYEFVSREIRARRAGVPSPVASAMVQ
jgi:hypothetical protein